MSTRIVSRPTKWIVIREGQPIFAENAIEVSIEDEAAGEFVVIEQDMNGKDNKIAIDPSEWPMLRNVIDRAFRDINRDEEAKP